MTSEGRKPDIGCWFLGAWLISLRTGEGLHRRTACLPGKCSRHLVTTRTIRRKRHPTLGAGCLLKDKATAFLIVRWKHTVDS